MTQAQMIPVPTWCNDRYDIAIKCGKWLTVITKDRAYGFTEHDVHGEGGSLKFEGNSLTEYDGMCALPKNVITSLKFIGIDNGEDCKHSDECQCEFCEHENAK